MPNLRPLPLAILLALTGCVAPTEPLTPSIDPDGRVPLEITPLEDLPPGAEPVDELTETVVWLHEDGTETVEVHPIDPSLGIVPYDEDDATSPLALTRDSGCAGASLWMSDATGNTGRRICFHTPPGELTEARLEDYCHSTALFCTPPLPGSPASCTTYCTASWAGRVRSAWSGDAPGFVYDSGSYLTCRDHFGIQHRRDSLTCGTVDRAQFGTDAQLIDVYRLYKPSDGHAWVGTTAERDAAFGTGWRSEGVGFRCWSAPVVGSYPVYRVWSRAQTRHMITVSDWYRDALIREEGFESQGILCHVVSEGSGYEDHYATSCGLNSTYSSAHSDTLFTVDTLEAQFADACLGYGTPDSSRNIGVFSPAGWTGCTPPSRSAEAIRWRDTGVCPSSTTGPRRTSTLYNVDPAEWDSEPYGDYQGSFVRYGTIEGDLLDIQVNGNWDVYFIPADADYECGVPLSTSYLGGFLYVGPWGRLSDAAGGTGMDRMFPHASQRSLREAGNVQFAACAAPREGTDIRELPLIMWHTAP